MQYNYYLIANNLHFICMLYIIKYFYALYVCYILLSILYACYILLSIIYNSHYCLFHSY